MNNVVKPCSNIPKIHQFCITDGGGRGAAGGGGGETTIAILFTPTERSKVDSPKKR